MKNLLSSLTVLGLVLGALFLILGFRQMGWKLVFCGVVLALFASFINAAVDQVAFSLGNLDFPLGLLLLIMVIALLLAGRSRFRQRRNFLENQRPQKTTSLKRRLPRH